jgi:hypothetical protein
MIIQLVRSLVVNPEWTIHTFRQTALQEDGSPTELQQHIAWIKMNKKYYKLSHPDFG